jgi:NADH:ubiquinone oxidoreductase subunit K
MYQGVATIAEASTALGVWAQYEFLQPLFCVEVSINSIKLGLWQYASYTTHHQY